MQLKVNVENIEMALALELIVKIYTLTSSEYIRSFILLDLIKITHKTITAADILHGLEITVMDHKTFKGSD
jgi:hypothetical protein